MSNVKTEIAKKWKDTGRHGIRTWEDCVFYATIEAFAAGWEVKEAEIRRDERVKTLKDAERNTGN